MTTDSNGDYRAAYTYGLEEIGVENLMDVEGKPNNPLYYLQDAIGSVTAITNMNSEVIDSNRFAPYGEALDPVAKNARLTNSPYGFTGEMHDIEGDLVYLRARYYSPDMMRFIQQDTYLGDAKEPLSRNLYAYANDNPLKYVDPSGHMNYFKQTDNLLDGAMNGVKNNTIGNIKDIIKSPRVMYDLGQALISGKIGIQDLVKAGLQGMVQDYLYIIKNADVLSINTKVTDKKVYEMGTHIGGIVVDIVGEVTSGGLAKIANIFSKVKGGDKIVKALKKIKIPAIKKNINGPSKAQKLLTPAKVVAKNPPNPYGKKGGLAHQNKISEVATKLEKLGYDVDFEHYVKIPLGGFKNARYGDIIATKGNDTWIIQIGKKTKGGKPISRETKAIKDLQNAGYKVSFVGYN